MRKYARLIILIIPFLTVSCSQGNNDKSPREKWDDQGIANYAFEVQVGCFCGIAGWTPAQVTVVNENVVSAKRLSDDESVPANILGAIPSVETLFETIGSAREQDAHSVEVDYHPSLGYPTSIAIDYIENAVDDEISYFASALTPTN